MEVRNVLKLPYDVIQRRSLELTVERGKYQGYRALIGERYELFFEPLRIGLAEAVESGNDTSLKEVTHVASSSRRSTSFGALRDFEYRWHILSDFAGWTKCHIEDRAASPH
jgi:hypothetical protein